MACNHDALACASVSRGLDLAFDMAFVENGRGSPNMLPSGAGRYEKILPEPEVNAHSFRFPLPGCQSVIGSKMKNLGLITFRDM